jgi:hypothetical protein
MQPLRICPSYSLHDLLLTDHPRPDINEISHFFEEFMVDLPRKYLEGFLTQNMHLAQQKPMLFVREHTIRRGR